MKSIGVDFEGDPIHIKVTTAKGVTNRRNINNGTWFCDKIKENLTDSDHYSVVFVLTDQKSQKKSIKQYFNEIGTISQFVYAQNLKENCTKHYILNILK